MFHHPLRLLPLLLLPWLARAVTSVEPAAAGPSPDVVKAMQAFRLPEGYTVTPFAVDHQLANPVAFCLDEQGRVYVAETFRFDQGTSDNRHTPFMLDDDLAAQSVEDRLAYYRRHADRLKGGFSWFTNSPDQVRLLVDSDGDGRADVSKLFAGDFREPLDGLGSGLLARDGEVWYTNIPHLWRLRDTDGDGVADRREKLLSGFGVRTAFLGHDMHGLTWGPDGRLYWSIGDRGFNVTSREGVNLRLPGRGAVFRSEPDGTGLEVFAFGLRNPQEIAFDRWGNLFTGDNNSDSGDKARIVHVMEGGDTGWNMEFQYMEGDYSRGPFNAEKIWHPLRDDNRDIRPAHTLPPLLNLGNGPAGFTHVPGGFFGESYRDHFLMCDYTGSPSGSKVWAFAVEPDGASFKVVNPRPFLQNICNTDVDFGYDGKLYVSDWIVGWKGSGKGRMYTVSHTGADPAVLAATRDLFRRGGWDAMPLAGLTGLLAADDQRVRLRAQFSLAARGDGGRAALEGVVRAGGPLFPARLHAMWGLGQIARLTKSPAPVESLAPLLADPDPETRAQVARLLGEARLASAVPALTGLLRDESPRVRSFAALALGRLGAASAVPAVAEMLRGNADRDVFLRHAGVMALAGAGDARLLESLARDPAPAVRMGALLAFRRLGDARLRGFLADADDRLVTEAARAIYDNRLEAALPDLAALVRRGKPGPAALARRVIAAAARAGDAAGLAAFAADTAQPGEQRLIALRALSRWADPSPRDAVHGQWWPGERRPLAQAGIALQPVIGALLKDTHAPLAKLAAELAGKLGLAGDDPDLFVKWAADTARDPESRVTALRALVEGRHARAGASVQAALADASEPVRAAAVGLLAGLNPAAALPEIDRVLASGGVLEQQAAYAALSALQASSPAAAARVKSGLESFVKGTLPATVRLDALEAARASRDPALAAAVAAWEKSLPAGDALAPHLAAVEGGDARRGEKVFQHHGIAQCVRCHLDGGGIGPDLRGVGKRLDRRALLEALVAPNAHVSPGYGTTSITTRDGRTVTGVQREETPGEVAVQSGDGTVERIPRAQIQAQVPPISVMPPMGAILTAPELRDLVEYISTVK